MPRKSKKLKQLEEQVQTAVKTIFDKIQDPLELALITGLAYQGQAIKIMGDSLLLNLIYGPLAYKLSTTPTSGEGSLGLTLYGVKIPFNSQTFGLTMLTALGFKTLFVSGFGQPGGWNIGGDIIEPLSDTKKCFPFAEWEALTKYGVAIPPKMICPEEWPLYQAAYPLAPPLQ